jgi:uncharacterized membrane protein
MNYKKLMLINLNLIFVAVVYHMIQILHLITYYPESYYKVIFYGSHYCDIIDYTVIINVILLIINLYYLKKK